MNNPKTEEIVASLRGCAHNNGLCSKCVVTGETDCNCRSELMCIAADRIEELQQELIDELQQELIDERYRHDRYADFCVAQGEELSKLKAQQRWIPVTERLPEDWEDVLIVSSGDISLGCYDACERYWVDHVNSAYDPVTHWMPLPEPPKEDK